LISRGCGAAYHDDGVGLVNQNKAADRCVEHGALRKCIVGRNNEFDLSITRRQRAGPRHLDGAGFAIKRNDAAAISDSLSQQHSHVARAASDFEHVHSAFDFSLVRPQGIVAFDEPVICVNALTLPAVDLATQSERCLLATFHALPPHADVGCRLVACFDEAGLPTDDDYLASLVGG
jgi:hypothetical protein